MRRSKEYRTSDLLSRAQNCRRRVFTVSEDKTIIRFVSSSKFNNNWDGLTKLLPWRTARQCRDRWTYYLSPANNLAPFSSEEDQLIVQKVNELGNKWANISKFFTGRSDNSIKNRWYSKLKSKCDVDEDGIYSLDPTKVVDAPVKHRGRSSKQNQKNDENTEKKQIIEPVETTESCQSEAEFSTPQEEKTFPSETSSPVEQDVTMEIASKAFSSIYSTYLNVQPKAEFKICPNNFMPFGVDSRNFLKQDPSVSSDLDFWDGEFIEWPTEVLNSSPNTEFGFI